MSARKTHVVLDTVDQMRLSILQADLAKAYGATSMAAAIRYALRYTTKTRGLDPVLNAPEHTGE